MLRRIFSAAAVGMVLLAATGATMPVGPEKAKLFLLVFFFVLTFMQVWPLVMTQRGHWGQRKHPVNKMYTFFSALGLAGTLGVVTVVFFNGDLEMLLTIAGPTMFLGVMGAAVLAFFATPWRDWSFREAERPKRSNGKAQRSRLGSADAE